MGEVPEWYELFVAAKYLGVAPWELLDQPVYWKEWAIAASSAEGSAKASLEAAAKRKRG